MSTVLLVVACSGRQDPAIPLQPVGPQALTLPPAVPVAEGLRVDLPRPPGRNELKKIEKLPGVAVATAVDFVRTRVRSGKENVRLRVIAADPLGFRSFAPAPTRDADFVWTSLAANKIVITHDAARSLGFRAPGSIKVRGHVLEVGAFADNGSPNLADVVVARTATTLTRGGRHAILVGARSAGASRRLESALRALLGRVTKITRLTLEPAEPVAAPGMVEPIGHVEGDLIGAMTFRILKSGFIEPDPAWVGANIASGTVPILGRITCHRVLFPQLVAALAEIDDKGLAHHIHPGDYGGCYVPRFIDRDPRRGLSAHAFGLALDLNVSDNYLGTRGDMDPRVVAIFERWGFAWGGRWSRPDPMHFELARLIDT
ncbi:MAG: M15 family metallopeptidase [Actinomycetota bacterium]|nr:M15 family metallopeptidase [Actinomycetota bacterium]